MKKYIAIIIFIVSVVLIGCNNRQRDEIIINTIEKMEQKKIPSASWLINNINIKESAALKLNFNVDVDFIVEEEEHPVIVQTNLNIFTQDFSENGDMVFHMEGPFYLNIFDGEVESQYDIDIYGTRQTDSYSIWCKDLLEDKWNLYNGFNDNSFDFSYAQVEDITENSKALFESAEVKECEFNGEECYSLSVRFDEDEGNEYIDSVFDVMNFGNEWDDYKYYLNRNFNCDIESLCSALNTKLLIYISKNTSELMGIEIDMSGLDVNDLFKAFGASYKDYKRLLDVELNDIVVNSFLISIYIDEGHQDILIPDSIKEESEEIVIDMLGSLYEIDEVQSPFYDNEIKEFELHDKEGKVLYTFKIPDGYIAVNINAEGTRCDIQDAQHNIKTEAKYENYGMLIEISNLAKDFVNGHKRGRWTEYNTDYWCEDYEVDGVNFILYREYGIGGRIAVYIPYIDEKKGTKEYIRIVLPTALSNEDASDDEVLDLALKLLNLK